LIRKEAVEIVSKTLKNQLVVAANGYISRDLFEVSDKPSNFYMIGSMGLASSIGLGLALKNPRKRIYVFDGDGNILMNLGSLVTIGSLKPKNLVHIIYDNGVHESTGSQPTNSKNIRLDIIAKASNYKVFRTRSKHHLNSLLKKIKKLVGPILILVIIEKGTNVSRRINLEPIEIKNRFMHSLKRI